MVFCGWTLGRYELASAILYLTNPEWTFPVSVLGLTPVAVFDYNSDNSMKKPLDQEPVQAMKSELHSSFPSPKRPPAASDTPDGFPGQGILGSFLLVVGVTIPILAFIDRTSGLPWEMPRTWYSSQMLWFFAAFACFLCGTKLSRTTPIENRRWQPEESGRRYDRVVIYTREGCHLCDQAKDVLWSYRSWLPEIEEVDITKDPKLVEQFGEQIPVVEIDDQVRFRGQVNEILLRRMIDATPPKERK